MGAALRRYPCVVLAFILAGAGNVHAQPAPRLGGIVHDAATARPIIGAIVTLGAPPNARTTRTDETGAFVFTNLSPLTYQINVRRLGFEQSERNVSVEGNTFVTIALNRLATLDTMRVFASRQGIFGVVATAHDLRPLPNTAVQVFGTSTGQAKTDTLGRFFYPVKTSGPYVIRARANGLGSQTASVTVHDDQAVEVALLLDTTQTPRANELEMAYGDFHDRLLRRGNASAIVPRAELVTRGSMGVGSALLLAPSFVEKSLRMSDYACIFLDGSPRPGMAPNMIDAEDVEAVEVYTATSDRSGNLRQRWPKTHPCGESSRGLPPGGRERPSDVVVWMVIWLKH